MAHVIIFFIIAIILFLVSFFLKPSLENNDLIHTYGTIEKVIYSDAGNVMYYISFIDNEKKVTAQTEYYSSSTKSLNPEDKVEIGYYYIKNKKPFAVIFDDRVIPCSSLLPTYRKIINVAGIVMLCFALFFLVKNFIL